ncbi:hypothetical protein PENSPDRAFT_319192 [Peniophora sp. CONT]|nr:hypothetical protein PENSPDRAFT_319192 [Peniophora sp. CONT]
MALYSTNTVLDLVNPRVPAVCRSMVDMSRLKVVYLALRRFLSGVQCAIVPGCQLKALCVCREQWYRDVLQLAINGIWAPPQPSDIGDRPWATAVGHSGHMELLLSSIDSRMWFRKGRRRSQRWNRSHGATGVRTYPCALVSEAGLSSPVPDEQAFKIIETSIDAVPAGRKMILNSYPPSRSFR